MHPHPTLSASHIITAQIRRRFVGTPSSSPKNTNLLFLTLAAGTAVGAYYFMRKAPEDLLAKARRDEEDMAQKARESLDAAKSRGDVKELGSDAKARYDSYKDSASDTLLKTRGSMAKAYDNTKATTDEKVAQVHSELGEQSQKVQQGWFSWLDWGKSNAQRRENDRPEDVQRGRERA